MNRLEDEEIDDNFSTGMKAVQPRNQERAKNERTNERTNEWGLGDLGAKGLKRNRKSVTPGSSKNVHVTQVDDILRDQIFSPSPRSYP